MKIKKRDEANNITLTKMSKKKNKNKGKEDTRINTHTVGGFKPSAHIQSILKATTAALLQQNPNINLNPVVVLEKIDFKKKSNFTQQSKQSEALKSAQQSSSTANPIKIPSSATSQKNNQKPILKNVRQLVTIKRPESKTDSTTVTKVKKQKSTTATQDRANLESINLKADLPKFRIPKTILNPTNSQNPKTDHTISQNLSHSSKNTNTQSFHRPNQSSFKNSSSNSNSSSFTNPTSSSNPSSFKNSNSSSNPSSFTNPTSNSNPSSFKNSNSNSNTSSFTSFTSSSNPSSFKNSNSSSNPSSITNPTPNSNPSSFKNSYSSSNPSSFRNRNSDLGPTNFKNPNSSSNPSSFVNPHSSLTRTNFQQRNQQPSKTDEKDFTIDSSPTTFKDISSSSSQNINPKTNSLNFQISNHATFQNFTPSNLKNNSAKINSSTVESNNPNSLQYSNPNSLQNINQKSNSSVIENKNLNPVYLKKPNPDYPAPLQNPSFNFNPIPLQNPNLNFNPVFNSMHPLQNPNLIPTASNLPNSILFSNPPPPLGLINNPNTMPNLNPHFNPLNMQNPITSSNPTIMHNPSQSSNIDTFQKDISANVNDCNSEISKGPILRKYLKPVRVSHKELMFNEPEIEAANVLNVWHKFILYDVKKDDKVSVLDAIIDVCKPFYLIPVMYTMDGENKATFLSFCRSNIVQKYVNRKMQVKLLTGKVVYIDIVLSFLPFKDMPLNPQTIITKCIISRFGKEATLKKSLNFKNFKEDKLLGSVYCPLHIPFILDYVFKLSKIVASPPNNQREAKIPIRDLILSENNLEMLVLSEKVFGSNFTRLDLRHNKLSNLNILRPFAEYKIVELWLDGNPLCANYSKIREYIGTVKQIFPFLQKLDDHVIGSETKLMPIFHRHYVNDSLKVGLVKQFVEHFFTCYDQDDRISLNGLYEAKAMYSMTFGAVNDISQQLLLKTFANNRNLLKFADYAKCSEILLQGPEQIMAALRKEPATIHRLKYLDIDLMYSTNSCFTVCVQGPYAYRGSHVSPLWFNRTLIVIAKEDNEFCIVNDHYNIDNLPSSYNDVDLSDLKFATEKSVIPFNPTPFSTSEKQQLLSLMQELTSINLNHAERYLQDANWDVHQSVKTFLQSYVDNKIAPEAFRSM